MMLAVMKCIVTIVTIIVLYHSLLCTHPIYRERIIIARSHNSGLATLKSYYITTLITMAIQSPILYYNMCQEPH